MDILKNGYFELDTSVARTDGNFLHFVQVNEWYCPIYGLVVWALRLFWKVFDWNIFDEITSNIGVITLVAFFFSAADGGGPKNASGESLFNQKKY